MDPTVPRVAGSRRPLLAVCLSHALLSLVFLSPAYIRPDSVAVFAWLRSAVFDRDFLFFDEWRLFRMIPAGFPLFKEVTPLGTLANHWWIGTSAVTLPPYLAARALAFLSASQSGNAGFLGIYAWTLAWTSVLFGIVVTILSLWIMRRLEVSRADSLLATGLVFSGTPLFWYEMRLPLGTHLAGAASVAVLMVLLHKALRPEPSDRIYVAIGLLLGIAIAIRLQHFVLVPAVAASLIMARAKTRQWIGIVAGSAPPLALQGVAWWIVYGTPFGPLLSGANASGTTWLPFRTISVVPVLLSSFHGLFPWAPVTLLAILGWLRPPSAERRFALVLGLVFAGELAANSLFDRFYWGGLSFGPRRFVDLALPFAIGLGWWLKGSALRRATAIAATAWTLMLTVASMAGTLGLRQDPGWRGLVEAVLHSAPRGITFASLHSLAGHPSSAVVAFTSFLIVAGFGFSLLALRDRCWLLPATLVYFVALTVAATSLWLPTRERALEAAVAEHLDLNLARRMGPLLDQRSLLGDDLQSARIHGSATAPIAAEISAVQRTIVAVGASGPAPRR